MKVKRTEHITSFSVRPDDRVAIDEINKLKAYAASKGISFSYLMFQAIQKINKELGL